MRGVQYVRLTVINILGTPDLDIRVSRLQDTDGRTDGRTDPQTDRQTDIS